DPDAGPDLPAARRPGAPPGAERSVDGPRPPSVVDGLPARQLDQRHAARPLRWRRSRPAAQGLVAFGVGCTLPTIASGIVEWRSAAELDQRVGVVHAVVNTLATTCYAASM